MGLFDFLKKDKTDGNTVKLTDYFSGEEIGEIKDLIRHNRMGAHYKTVYHQTAAKSMIGYMSSPDKSLNSADMKQFIKTAETIMLMEPSLKSVLEKGLAGIQGTESSESSSRFLNSITEKTSTQDAKEAQEKEAAADKMTASEKEAAADKMTASEIKAGGGKEELLKAIEQSDLSYEELMSLLKERKQS